MKLNIAFAFATIVIVCSTGAHAAAKKDFTVKVKLADGADLVNGISSKGKVFSGVKKGSSVSIKIPSTSLQGTSFYATKGGRFVGPVYVPTTAGKGMLFLAKKPKDENKVALTSLSIKLKAKTEGENFISTAKAIKGTVFDKKIQYTMVSTPALGLNSPQSSQFKNIL